MVSSLGGSWLRIVRRGVALTATWAVAAFAQTGRIVGTVTDADGKPLADAHVALSDVARSTVSGPDGAFSFTDVPAGTYDVRVFRVGYRASILPSVSVRSGEVTRINARIEGTTVILQAVAVSVSRRAEKVTEAPAAVTVFTADRIADGLGSTATTLLKEAPGITLTQVGVTSSFLNGRGFNKVFNTRWLTLEDGRVAVLAETGLSIGEHTTIPRVDIADIEAIAGPGSALYGANASGGLVSIRTKDPRQYPGAILELTGGTRGLHDAQLRYAGSSGRWGYKFAGQDLAARDWTDTTYYPAVSPGGAPLREVARDFGTRVTRGTGSLRYYFGGGGYAGLSTGASLRSGLGQTGQGRYRISNYQYQHYQLLLTTARWFAQAYASHSNTGNTYQLNTFTQTQARFPGLAADSVRRLAAFPVDGRILALEIQNNQLVGARLRTGVSAVDNSHVTWGALARRDRVSSYGRVYSDVATGKPIFFDQGALYAQVESPVTKALRFVAAGRYDKHNRFPARASPKVGLVYDVGPDQAMRLTYNDAYLTPTVLQTDLYNYNPGARLLVLGNSHGFDVKDASGTPLGSVNPIGPETNQTWELGYKGVLADRLYADFTAYHSRFRNFTTPSVLIANPTASPATFAYDRRTGQLIADASGAALQTRSFINVGDAVFDGVDAALRYYVEDRLAISSTMTFVRLDTIKTRPTDPPEATAFNTSSSRITLGIETIDLPKNFSIGLSNRYVLGYLFRSGSDWGQMPTFGTLGLSARYRLPSREVTFLLQADNVATCVSGTSTPPATGISPAAQATYTARQSCGLGLRHHEILNMPAVGTMIFVGARYEWR